MGTDEMTARKNTIRKKIESGELGGMSNKELKNIISEILADDLNTHSRTDQKTE